MRLVLTIAKRPPAFTCIALLFAWQSLPPTPFAEKKVFVYTSQALRARLNSLFLGYFAPCGLRFPLFRWQERVTVEILSTWKTWLFDDSVKNVIVWWQCQVCNQKIWISMQHLVAIYQVPGPVFAVQATWVLAPHFGDTVTEPIYYKSPSVLLKKLTLEALWLRDNNQRRVHWCWFFLGGFRRPGQLQCAPSNLTLNAKHWITLNCFSRSNKNSLWNTGGHKRSPSLPAVSSAFHSCLLVADK